jgi:uncharacterized protein
MQELNFGVTSKTHKIWAFELDFTNSCNLECQYCYKKDKSNSHIPKKVAFDALVWMLKVSRPIKNILIALMGGEPLMNFAILKDWLPFAMRRSQQEGIRLGVSMTTNCTLVTDEVVDLFKRWNARFHTSIDGDINTQNINRPTKSGGPSFHLAEAGAKKILTHFPNTTARSTIFPQSVTYIVDSYLYLKSLGYTDIAMLPSNYIDWSEENIEQYKKGLYGIADEWMNDFRSGKIVTFKIFEDFLLSRCTKSNKALTKCGGGQEMVSIDINGNIWPCSRMTKFKSSYYCFGNIYEKFVQKNQDEYISTLERLTQHKSNKCDSCMAKDFCQNTCYAEHLECIGVLYGQSPNQCGLTIANIRVGEYIYQTLSNEKNPLFFKTFCTNGGTKFNNNHRFERR